MRPSTCSQGYEPHYQQQICDGSVIWATHAKDSASDISVPCYRRQHITHVQQDSSMLHQLTVRLCMLLSVRGSQKWDCMHTQCSKQELVLLLVFCHQQFVSNRW